MKPLHRSVKALSGALARLVRETRGATAIEYGLIVALIVVGLIAAIGSVGKVTSGMWNSTNAKMGSVTPQ